MVCDSQIATSYLWVAKWGRKFCESVTSRIAFCESEMRFLHPISDFAGSQIANRAICDSQNFATSGP
ncbi:hypothetical protein NDU88_001782 [Pleurodeles waltl]|uniref:Uncharacterized protein n=1 Tax=Pleurodeles waltl TaxID=8319 RepID=A0AAV7TJV8_PLEWA|nr:hypothetical protein NDU88_001782 [Pleurodeles waltl]